jgi:hypothetical protein
VTPSPRPLTPAGSEVEGRVVALRTSGWTFEQIADEVGLSGRSQAFRLLQRALRRRPAEMVDELRALDSARLDALTMAVWPKALTGDVKAAGTMLKILERRAKMFGLDREVTSSIDADPSHLDQAADKLLERIAIFEDLLERGAIALPAHLKHLEDDHE